MERDAVNDVSSHETERRTEEVGKDVGRPVFGVSNKQKGKGGAKHAVSVESGTSVGPGDHHGRGKTKASGNVLVGLSNDEEHRDTPSERSDKLPKDTFTEINTVLQGWNARKHGRNRDGDEENSREKHPSKCGPENIDDCVRARDLAAYPKGERKSRVSGSRDLEHGRSDDHEAETVQKGHDKKGQTGCVGIGGQTDNGVKANRSSVKEQAKDS